MTKYAWILAAGIGVTGASAHGALVFEENFDYGNTNSNTGLTNWSDSSNAVTYNTLNLTLSNLPYDGGANGASTGSIQFSGSGSPRGGQVVIDSDGLSGQFWVSYLVRTTGVDAAGENVVTSLHDSASYSFSNPVADGFGVGWDGSGRRVLFRDQSANSVTFGTGLSLANNEVGLLIAKVTVNAAADDSVSLWLMNSASSFGITEASLGVPLLSVNNADWGDSVSRMWAGRFADAMSANIDAIRISDTAGDAGLAQVIAVPEPGMLSLGALAGLALLRRRR